MSRFIAVLIVALALITLASPLFAEDTATPAASDIFLSGTVIDKNGKPVAKAKLTVQVYTQGKEKSEDLVSDKAGKFKSTLALDPKSPYASILALADGYCSSRQYISQQNISNATITLWPGYTLIGKIVDEKGRLLAGAKVDLNGCYAYANNSSVHAELPDKLRSVVIGKDGVFKFSNLPYPDDFEYIDANISVSAPGRALIHKSIQKDAMREVVKIIDPLECKLDGTLYLPGKTGFAPEGTGIVIQVPVDRGSESRSTNVGKDGTFHFTQLPPGKVNVMLSGNYRGQGKSEPMAWALPAVMDVALSHKQAKNIELVMVPGALIKGKILDKATGNGVASARLSINHPGRPENTFPDNAATDDKGEFNIRVVDGQTTITVDGVDGQPRIWFQYDERPTINVNVAEGEEKSDVALKIDLNQNNECSWDVQSKPVPHDFELKPGTYDLVWDPDVDCSDAVYISRKYEGDKVNGIVKKLPELASTKAKRLAYPLDGSENDGLLFVVIDESKGTGKGWDTAYIDMNRNGDLTDDEPVHFIIRKNYNMVKTDWFTAQAHQGLSEGDRTDHPMQIRLEIYGDPNNLYVQIQRKGAWKGTIDSNKGMVNCIAADTTSNGVCSDLGDINDRLDCKCIGDSIFVDLNGFGRVVATSWSPHCIDLNKITKVADSFYIIKVSPVGNRITVEPYTGDLGQLVVRGVNIQGRRASTESMSVISKTGYYSFSNCDNRPITLPAGKYNISSCEMTLDTPNKLNVTCSPDSSVTIDADKMSMVTIAGKLSLAINLADKELILKPGVSNTISWDIKVGGKTTVSAFGDSNQSNPPKVKFLKNGKLLYTTTAGYT
ncbi:MAG: carboxypeptidase-like regulatory domain-containing protein [Armatimonadota bacterium]|nr:carboxypeptidase-like regulatory domain-containing protein [bacterium]